MATPCKIKDDFLTCSICMEVFQQPATLACQHSYCQNCLTQYLQTQPEAVTAKSIPCPSCRQQTPVPHPDRPVDEWAGQLKPGLLLTGLMDSYFEENDTSKLSFTKLETSSVNFITHFVSKLQTPIMVKQVYKLCIKYYFFPVNIYHVNVANNNHDTYLI